MCYVVLCIEVLIKNETKLDGVAPPPVYVTLYSSKLFDMVTIGGKSTFPDAFTSKAVT